MERKRSRNEFEASGGYATSTKDAVDDDDERDAKRGAFSPFDWLPNELVIAVLLATHSAAAIGAWAATSKRSLALSGDPVLWQSLYQGRFDTLTYCNLADAGKDWRWAFRARAYHGGAGGGTAGEVDFLLEAQRALYWGDLADGVPRGFGLCATLPLGEAACRYEGQLFTGKRHGRGHMTWADGERYEGDYLGCAW
jgi:hypothetical protein